MAKRIKRQPGRRASVTAKPQAAGSQTWTLGGKALQGKGAELVAVEDAWGRTHTVPRAALPESPPPGATVIDLTGPDATGLLKWLAYATGKEPDLARGQMTLTDGDFKKLAAGKALQRTAERPLRIKGGTARKRRPGIWQHACDLVRSRPNITVREAWESFPTQRDAATFAWQPGPDGRDVEVTIYRDENDLVEVEDVTARVRKITYGTFRRYITRAKKDLRNN